MRSSIYSFVVILFINAAAFATEIRVLNDFEAPADLKAWEFKKATAQLTPKHAAHGNSAVQIAANEYMATFRKQDWSGFDALDMDIFAETDEPVAVSVLIGDEAWRAKNGSYWNRYNGAFNLSPGKNTLSIPVGGLYRGEAGSRNNDLKSNIDPKSIIRCDIGFSTKSGKGTLYLDHMRLTKESLPDGVLAFDFGPENQVLAPGFTAVSWNTVHKKDGRKFGLQFPTGSNSARDDTFPTRLYQDYVSMEGNEFRADVPDGLYHVWLMYDDCGYWGGEEARFKTRSVLSGGETLWSETRDPADYLYRFENVEPQPGQSIWDLYMKDLFAPKKFDVTVKGGVLRLKFTSEGALGSKVAGLIVYPDAKNDVGEKFCAEVEARNRAEFEAKAVFVSKPAEPDPTGNATHIKILPGIESKEGAFQAIAARGQRVSVSFAFVPSKDFTGPVTLTSSELKGTADSIPASAVECRVVRNAVHRGYNSIAYSIGPESLVGIDNSPTTLTAKTERQFWITVSVPEGAAGGIYGGSVDFSCGELKAKMGYSIDVIPVKLDEPDFAFGPFGVHVPDEFFDKAQALRQLLGVLKDYGMNSFSGGPSIHFNGLDADGKPKLDFKACDEFMAIVKEAGFTKELDSYGGPGMVSNLHDSYQIGETGREWEKKTGKSMGKLLEVVWKAIAAHAKEAQWLPIAYELTDEPRVVETAQKQLELMHLYREHVPFVDIGGSYSVAWNKTDPFDLAVQDIFKTLNWSSLNEHSQIDFDKAKELGKRIYVYNQGTSRYSFGAYQWAEFRKGVRGRMQWHLLALHGWQYFDLDGREPDTAMINWGRNEVIPTLKLAHCRDGADDFRFAVTLWNLAEKKKDTPAGRSAQEWLDGIAKQIAPGERTPPKGFMSDDEFRRGCAQRIKELIQ